MNDSTELFPQQQTATPPEGNSPQKKSHKKTLLAVGGVCFVAVISLGTYGVLSTYISKDTASVGVKAPVKKVEPETSVIDTVILSDIDKEQMSDEEVSNIETELADEDAQSLKYMESIDVE